MSIFITEVLYSYLISYNGIRISIRESIKLLDTRSHDTLFAMRFNSYWTSVIVQKFHTLDFWTTSHTIIFEEKMECHIINSKSDLWMGFFHLQIFENACFEDILSWLIIWLKIKLTLFLCKRVCNLYWQLVLVRLVSQYYKTFKMSLVLTYKSFKSRLTWLKQSLCMIINSLMRL